MLNCEGALPKLLQLLARTGSAERLADKILTASAQVTLTHVPSLDEIKQVIGEVSDVLLHVLVLPAMTFVQCHTMCPHWPWGQPSIHTTHVTSLQ